MSFYDIKIDVTDVTVENHDRAVLCQDIGF